MNETQNVKDNDQLEPQLQPGSHPVIAESVQNDYLHNHYDHILSASTASRLNVILPTFIQSERINSFGYHDPISQQLLPQQTQLATAAPLRSQSSPVKVQRQTQRRFSQDLGMNRKTSPLVSGALKHIECTWTIFLCKTRAKNFQRKFRAL